MKFLSLFVITFLSFNYCISQSKGRIIYNETVKIEIEGLSEEMADMMPSSQSIKKELAFSSNESVYQNLKGEELEDLSMESEDGSFQIKFKTDDTENILYKNLKEKSIVHQKGLMGKSFVVSDDLNTNKWKLTGEKIKYLGYECQKATIEDEDGFVVAWFSPQIPVQMGPGKYHGLPGAILMVSVDDGKREIKALEVKLESLDAEALLAPKKGKKVSEEEYQEIEKQKIAEMEETYGSRTIKIRN